MVTAREAVSTAEPNGPFVADLRRDGVVGDDEVRRVAAAYLANPECGPFRLLSGHTLDVAAAVGRHQLTVTALADPKTPGPSRRLLVLNALSLARTVAPPTAETHAALTRLTKASHG